MFLARESRNLSLDFGGESLPAAQTAAGPDAGIKAVLATASLCSAIFQPLRHTFLSFVPVSGVELAISAPFYQAICTEKAILTFPMPFSVVASGDRRTLKLLATRLT
jgi:hypothetical protein